MRLKRIGIGSRAALLALALFPGGAPAKDSDRESVLPLKGRGDLPFLLDASAFRSDGGLTEEEIVLSLSNDLIAFKTVEEKSEGRLRLEVEMIDSDGKTAFETTQTLVPTVSETIDASDRMQLQLIRTSAFLKPGEYVLQVLLVDELSEKPGIIHMIRKTKKKGTVDAMLTVPGFGAPGIETSEIAFCRDLSPSSSESDLARNGLRLDLNPSRQYGLVLPSLSYYAEVYAGEEFAAGDSIFVRTSVLDIGGVSLFSRTQVAAPSTAAFVAHDALDLSRTFRAGTYVLEIAAQNRRTGSFTSTKRPFEVIWAIASWGLDPETILEEMKLVMRGPQYKEFQKLSPGAREVYLAEFWNELDPAPESPQNEALLEFRRRVLYADREFMGTIGRGLLTDRGRVYARYGPPDEISYQYSSSAFGNDENVERVSDPAERVGLSNRPGASYLSPDEFREGDVGDLETQRGGTNIKSKQLEVWTYDGPGRPLAGRSAGDASSRGLKFIFADEMGNGEYELIGSSGTTDF